MTGVDYFIGTSTSPATPGLNFLAVDTYEVSAQAQVGYVLNAYTGPWTLTVGKDSPPKVIRFIGVASEGSAYGFSNTIGLPAGWQPGDTAIVFAANATPATPPVIPAGWVHLANASPAWGTSPAAVSRVGSRVLQAGDTDTGIWTNTRDIAVVVYRNVGSVGPATYGGYSTTSTSGTKFVTFPAPAAVKSATSWLVGLGYLNSSAGYNQVYGITAPTGTVNRTVTLPAPPFSGIGTSSRLAVIDSNAGAGWTTSQQVTGGITRPALLAWAMNGITLELKVQ